MDRMDDPEKRIRERRRRERERRKRQRTRRRLLRGCACLLLLVLILGSHKLWNFRKTPAQIPYRALIATDGEPTATHVKADRSYSKAERTILAFCTEYNLHLSDYPEDLRRLLEYNPETKDYVLHYPLEQGNPIDVDLSAYADSEEIPLFLQWDRQWGYMTYGGQPAALTACGPVCLSMVAYYLTGNDAYSPDRVIEFAQDNGYYSPGSGSRWTLISTGAETLGFTATEIPLVKAQILNYLEDGNPIICAMGPGDFTSSGHFIVLSGTENGLLRINDPNSIKNSEKLWKFEDIESQFRNLWVIEK